MNLTSWLELKAASLSTGPLRAINYLTPSRLITPQMKASHTSLSSTPILTFFGVTTREPRAPALLPPRLWAVPISAFG